MHMKQLIKWPFSRRFMVVAIFASVGGYVYIRFPGPGYDCYTWLLIGIFNGTIFGLLLLIAFGIVRWLCRQFSRF